MIIVIDIMQILRDTNQRAENGLKDRFTIH